MDRWVEAADWIVWQLCGERDAQRLHGRLQGICQDGATRRADYLAALDARFAGFVDDKLEARRSRALGDARRRR